MQANLAALLCYLPLFAGLILAIIFYIIEKENKFLRFHAMQAILLWAALTVISILLMVTLIGMFLVPFVGVGGLVIAIIMMINSYQGEELKLPVIGNIAQKNA